MRNLGMLFFVIFSGLSTAHAFSFDSDVPKLVQKRFLADLNFVGGLQGGGATPIHQKIFGQVSGAAYMNFFKKRISSIGLDDCGGSPAAAACVIPGLSTTKMFVTPLLVKLDVPQIYRIMIYFHEARHTESSFGNWGHVACPKPFIGDDGKLVRGIISGIDLSGKPGCDDNFMGAYGVGTEMIGNIGRSCTNCTAKLKMDAIFYAKDTSKRIINKEQRQALQHDLFE